MDVATAAAPAARHDEAVVALQQLADPGSVGMGAHDGARRDPQHDLGSVAAMGLAPGPGTAGAGSVVRGAHVVAEGRHAGFHDHDHVAAAATVAAVRPAARDVRLAAKGRRAVATRAGGDVDPGVVGEHRSGNDKRRPMRAGAAGRDRGVARDSATG